MLRRNVLLFGLVGGFGFALAFVAALYAFGSPTANPAEHRVEESVPHRLRVAPDAELVRWFLFEDGERVGPVLSPMPAGLVGLSSTELADGQPQWRLLSFSEGRVVVEEHCSQLTGGFLRSEHGALAVYEGDIDGCHRKKGTIELDGGLISPLQELELELGVPFSSEAELVLLLEGIAAP